MASSALGRRLPLARRALPVVAPPLGRSSLLVRSVRLARSAWVARGRRRASVGALVARIPSARTSFVNRLRALSSPATARSAKEEDARGSRKSTRSRRNSASDAGNGIDWPVTRETQTIVWKPQATGSPSLRTTRKQQRSCWGTGSSNDTSTVTRSPVVTGARAQLYASRTSSATASNSSLARGFSPSTRSVKRRSQSAV